MSVYDEIRNKLISRDVDLDSLTALSESLLLEVTNQRAEAAGLSPSLALAQLDALLLGFMGRGNAMHQDFEAGDACLAGLALALNFSDEVSGHSVGVSLALRLLRELTKTPVTDLVGWLDLRSTSAYLHLEKTNVKRQFRSSRAKENTERGFFDLSPDEAEASYACGIKLSSADSLMTGYTRRAISGRQQSTLFRLLACLGDSAAIFAALVHPLAVSIRRMHMEGMPSKSLEWVRPILNAPDAQTILRPLVAAGWNADWGAEWHFLEEAQDVLLEVFRFDQGENFGITDQGLWCGNLPVAIAPSSKAWQKRKAVTRAVLTAYVNKISIEALKDIDA